MISINKNSGCGPALLSVLLMAAALPGVADEVGQSRCGRPVYVQGEIKHVKIKGQVKVSDKENRTMFQEEIYGKRFTARVEGLPEDMYTIAVHLAETYHEEAGKRIFSILSGDLVLARNLDVYAEAGFKKEYVVQGEVFHQDDNINGPLTIQFESTKDHAFVNALVIRNSGGAVVSCVKAHELVGTAYLFATEIPKVDGPVLYTDSKVPVERRVKDLVRRMSLNEKVGQLQNNAPEIARLGVPGYEYWNECLHGVARAGEATVFPQAIAMASMWDEGMMRAVADVIATEGRAKNNAARAKSPNTKRYFGLTFWTPNINIFRDPRWGRGHETYGEDPYLTGRLAVAFIKGLQGDDPNYYKAMACAKHFAVHSGPEKLRHEFDAVPSERDLYETYLPQFEMAVKEGRVGIVMSAYNSVYGIPGPANKFLLTDLLRDQWGFTGHVVSDCGGVRDVWANHKYVETAAEASALSIKAGNDLNCGTTYNALAEAVVKKLVTEAEIDRALSRVLEARFRLGLFDSPEECAFLRIPAEKNNAPEHGQLALNVARKSMVLLKNDGILPLDKSKLKQVAVIGPNGNDHRVLHANYNGDAANPVSILEGIQNELGPQVAVEYAPGCPIAMMPDEPYGSSNKDYQAALKLAKASDIIFYVGGLSARIEGEEMKRLKALVGFDKGDRTLIELPEAQTTLIKALVKTGKPVIMVNLSGSSVAMPWEAENVPAILQAWYPGQQGGTAVADVLFGKTNPAGRLPVTFYKATQDLPDFTDYSMANRTYRYFNGKPEFAFGHGLSYSTFEYSPLALSSQRMGKEGRVKVRVEVANTGKMDGDEVVQLYVRHLSSPVPQPKHSLAGFKRMFIKAGGSEMAEFELSASALRYWDTEQKQYVVPSGKFEIQVGAASDDIRQRMDCVVE